MRLLGEQHSGPQEEIYFCFRKSFWHLIPLNIFKNGKNNPYFSVCYIFMDNFLTIFLHCGFSLFLITGGSLSVTLTLQANRIVILFLEYSPPLQGSPFKLNVLLGGSTQNSQVSSALSMFLSSQLSIILSNCSFLYFCTLEDSTLCTFLIQSCTQHCITA